MPSLPVLPGVVLWGGLATGEDPVEATERIRIECHVKSANRGVELFHRAWPDDRRGHGGLVKQPGQTDVAGLVAELGREVLVPFDGIAVGGESLRRTTLKAALAFALLADDPAEEPAVQR